MSLPTANDVIAFWRTAGQDKWFSQDDAFDAAIRTKFLDLLEAAAAGDLAAWEETPDGALALVIVLDQFPRNLFRGSPRTYATDAAARAVSQRARARGFERRCDSDLAFFLYMPLMHSEALPDQDLCLAFFETQDLPDNLRAARRHRGIIARFGRFPHRNPLLGRATTAEEKAYLDADGFKG
jgi:uncharacterized protein (DUF924 family)